jgi:hypothetical protein
LPRAPPRPPRRPCHARRTSLCPPAAPRAVVGRCVCRVLAGRATTRHHRWPQDPTGGHCKRRSSLRPELAGTTRSGCSSLRVASLLAPSPALCSSPREASPARPRPYPLLLAPRDLAGSALAPCSSPARPVRPRPQPSRVRQTPDGVEAGASRQTRALCEILRPDNIIKMMK